VNGILFTGAGQRRPRGAHISLRSTATLNRAILSAAEESRRISRHPYRLKLPLHKCRSPFAPRANMFGLSPRLQIGVPGERHFVRWGEHRPERSRRRSEPYSPLAPTDPMAPASLPNLSMHSPCSIRELSVIRPRINTKNQHFSRQFGVLSHPNHYN